MDDFKVQLAYSWVEDPDCTVDGLRGEVSFLGSVHCDPVGVCIIDKPGDLVVEELLVVVGVEVRL